MQNQKRYERLSLEIRSEIKCSRKTGENSKHKRHCHAGIEQTLAAFGFAGLTNYCVNRHYLSVLSQVATPLRWDNVHVSLGSDVPRCGHHDSSAESEWLLRGFQIA